MLARAAIRDVGRVLGHPYGEVDRIAKAVPNQLGIRLEEALEVIAPNEKFRAVASIGFGAVKATFTTDAAGTFSVSVAPGTYTLRSKNGLPTLKSSTVVVAAGEYTDVELHADTGIR